MNDFLSVILSRVDPHLARALEPVLSDLRLEFGGTEVYIASPRAQRIRDIRNALSDESITRVAERYRISRRTVQRLARH